MKPQYAQVAKGGGGSDSGLPQTVKPARIAARVKGARKAQGGSLPASTQQKR